METKAVLIVDDDRIIRVQLEKQLKRYFYKTFIAATGQDALHLLSNETIDILIIDVRLKNEDGLEILKKAKEKYPSCEVIVITGFGSQEVAIKAIRRGAIDYIEKPIQLEELNTALGRALEKITEREELSYKYSLLILDDDESTTRTLTRFFKRAGYQALGATKYEEGIIILENKRVDVVVIDVFLGVMDGIEVLQKAKVYYPEIEGIVVTGSGDHELAIKALRAGAIDYITKPVDLDELLISVQKAIERVNLRRNSLFRHRELKISSEIITKMNEELERRIDERTREVTSIQAQLFQTSKLATLGEMAAGLAHEINQPLGGISLISKHFRKMLERDKLTTDEIESGLNDIDAAVQRMTKIIRHVRTFARQDEFKFSEVAINETVDFALNFIKERMRLHEIDLTEHLTDELPKILGEPYQLEQVWLNLLSNAVDAIEIKRAQMKEDEEQTAIDYGGAVDISSSYDSERQCVKVCVSDNGVGIAEGEMEKVLDPFFTTKEVGKATGLGLSISYGIIKNHKGDIHVESEAGVGTQIHVQIPIAS